MVAKRPPGPTCPLCGKRVAGLDLEALGKHFQACPETDRARTRAQDAGGE